VIRFRFTHDDLLRTRFAISPLCEVVWSTHVLRRPERHAIHRPWVVAARERLRGLDWSLLDELANRSKAGYVPDFISPPPATALPDLPGELDRIRSTPHDQVAREVAWRFEGEELPAVARPLVEDPDHGLAALAGLMAAYWERAIEPWWPAIRAALEADIVHRARRLTTGGTIGVFDDLHSDVRWHDGSLEVRRAHEQEVVLAGRGLLLVPAAFAWPAVFAMTDEPWQPAVIYTPRGIGELWAPPAAEDRAALEALLGRRRAALLAELRAPAATTELARRLGASPAGVSEHLAILRRAGLVRAWRDGRRVLYARTAAGDGLVRARG
jgi:DNA-binding transcriptional ArsR family regulator